MAFTYRGMGKQTSIRKDCNFTGNRDQIKSKETRVVAYTCNYSRQLIPIFQSVAVSDFGIKGPLEYLQV